VHVDGKTEILSAEAGGSVTVYGPDKRVAPGLLITVPKYSRHDWGRAREHLARNRPSCVKPSFPIDIDEEVVVEEWTEPADISKPLFFWNLNGVVLEATSSPCSFSTSPPLPPLQRFVRWMLGTQYWISFQLFTIFWELDNWPVVLDLRGVLGGGMSWLLPDGVYLRVRHRLPKLLWVERGKRKVEGWAEWLVTMAVVGVVRILGWGVGVRAVERERTPVGLWEEYQRKGVLR
jgi:hypothetical protein